MAMLMPKVVVMYDHDEYLPIRYQAQVVKNAQVLADGLISKGYTIVTGGTDNHLVLLDLRNKKLSGSKGERILEDVGISVNKNTGNLFVALLPMWVFGGLILYVHLPFV